MALTPHHIQKVIDLKDALLSKVSEEKQVRNIPVTYCVKVKIVLSLPLGQSLS
jgi:hypothetical protein